MKVPNGLIFRKRVLWQRNRRREAGGGNAVATGSFGGSTGRAVADGTATTVSEREVGFLG